MGIMRTLRGIIVRRRCDCGCFMAVVSDDGDRTLLKCPDPKCGREEKVHFEADNSLQTATA
jgi:hypothetical protein